NACLVLLLVAVSVDYINGTSCKSNSDCTGDNNFCFMYDQCDEGWCQCNKGYENKNGNCVEGASQLSVSLLALGGLLVTAVLTKFY
ncbi:hypothetical protein LSAT2_012462, partial [Lamellibrachia satsuma]